MRNYRNKKEIRTCVTVTAEECHNNTEKMVRRFIKKVKNDGIVDEFKERSRYKKPSVVKAEKKRNKRRLIEKALKRQRELFSNTERKQTRYRGRG